MVTKEIPLPSVLRAADLKYPSWKSKVKRLYDAGDGGTLQLYYTQSFGWLIAVRAIGSATRARSRGLAARTYASSFDVKTGEHLKSGYRVGAGPHVLRTLTVYLTTKNQARLAKLIEAYTKGAGDAGVISDRISTRRAMGALRRQQWGY